MKLFLTLILLLLASITSAFTQTKTFIREYRYKANELDNEITSRTIALSEAKRILLEEIGVYLESTFETIREERTYNGETTLNDLTSKKITIISAGITKTKILEEKWDGKTYYLKAEITVDADGVAKKLKEIANDKEKVKELEDLQKRVDEANVEIENLKKELADAKTKPSKISETERSRIQSFYNEKIDVLTAVEWFYKGYDAVESKDYENGIDYFTKAIALNPQLAEAYNNRGNAKSYLQDFHGAIEDYNKAIAINPKLASAYNNRGNVKGNIQDVRGAINDYTKAISIDMQDSEVYFNRGMAKCKLQDYRGAIVDYNKAIEINPQYGEAYYNRGFAKGKLQNYDGAIKDFDKAIAINPQNAMIYYNRGIVKDYLENYHGAIEDYNKAVEINPQYSEAYYNRGTIRAQNFKDYREALDDYNKTIAINPLYAIAFNNRGIVKDNLGDKSGACLDWKKAGELGYTQAYVLIKQFCK